MKDTLPVQVLREYALLADGERGALIGPRGDIAWMCAPQWHDDAVFSSLIGGGGVFSVTPTDPRMVWGGQYEDGTLIWRSRWVTTGGIVECREALALPSDKDRAILLRRLRVLEGTAPVRVRFDPRPGFGRDRIPLRHDGGVWAGSGGGLHVRLSGLAGATLDGDGLTAELALSPGREHDLVLELSAASLPAMLPAAGALWESSEREWAAAVPGLQDTVCPDDARQSYAVLHGLTSSTGAMVAAATMALPERAAAKRNYDYRYAWIRDQCYAGLATGAGSATALFCRSVDFVADRLLADGADLKPAYTVSLGRVPDERSLDLPGYPGGSDKVGNWVNEQFQLDNFGEALLLFAAAAGHGPLAPDQWKAAEQAVAGIEHRWQEPDAGIWELHNDRWTHSRLTCVAGLRAIARFAPRSQARRWGELADRILARTAATSVHPSGRWQRSPTDARLDASLLLPAIRGAVAPTDPRSLATVKAVRSELEEQEYVYRFRHDDRPLADAEGAFLLCGFNLALALHRQGDELEAFRRFERNRAACGSPGLFTEEYDVGQRQLRGNLPQAFVHAAMLETSHRLYGSG